MKMNTPNKISIVRILLLPVFLFFYLATFIPFGIGKIIAFVVFLFAEFTDFLDGYLARKNNQVTTLGKFLDSIADKILCTTGVLVLVVDQTITHPYGIIFLFIMILRDFIVSALRQVAAAKNIVIAADMAGKVKANFTYVSIILGFVINYINTISGDTVQTDHSLYITMQVLHIIFDILLIVTTILTIYSGVRYIVRNKQALVEDDNKTVIEPQKDENISEQTTKQTDNKSNTEDNNKEGE